MTLPHDLRPFAEPGFLLAVVLALALWGTVATVIYLGTG